MHKYMHAHICMCTGQNACTIKKEEGEEEEDKKKWNEVNERRGEEGESLPTWEHHEVLCISQLT